MDPIRSVGEPAEGSLTRSIPQNYPPNCEASYSAHAVTATPTGKARSRSCRVVDLTGGLHGPQPHIYVHVCYASAASSAAAAACRAVSYNPHDPVLGHHTWRSPRAHQVQEWPIHSVYTSHDLSYRSASQPEDSDNRSTTLSNGYLGSRNDEERSEMRYVMRIAEFSESSNL